jgi:hypothetical protein
VGCIWVGKQKVIWFSKFRENRWVFAASALSVIIKFLEISGY